MSVKRTVLQRVPIAELPGYELRLVKLEFGPGVKGVPHTHPVVGAGVVLEGEYIEQWEGGPEQRWKAGESIIDAAHEVHIRTENGSSDKPLVIVMSYVIPVGTPNVVPLQQ